jgi:hypothetical protein
VHCVILSLCVCDTTAIKFLADSERAVVGALNYGDLRPKFEWRSGSTPRPLDKGNAAL